MTKINTTSKWIIRVFKAHSQFVMGMTINSKSNLLPLSIVGIFIWLMFFLRSLHNFKQIPAEGEIFVLIELLVQIATVYILIRQYQLSKLEYPNLNNKSFIFWLMINIWLICVDVLFYIATYLSKTYLQHLSNLNFIFYYVPCAIYAVLTTIFLGSIILKKMLVNKVAIKNIVFLIILSFVVFKLYLSAVHYAYPVFSFQTTLQVILLFTEFILFDVCIIGMIYAVNLEAFILLISIIALITGDFFLTYTYISQIVERYFIIGEFCWCLGLILLFLSALSIKENRSFFINDWFRSDNAIKSRIGLNVYFISIASFLMIYGFSYYLGLMKQDFLVIFPILTMLYSIIVVIFSVTISNQFAEPFKQIRKIINELLTEPNTQTEQHYESDIEEFDDLHQVLTNSVQAVKLNVAFGNISATAAHSLGSPLASARGAMLKIRNSDAIKGNIDNLSLAITRIEEVMANVLEQYRNLNPLAETYELQINDDANQSRFINLEKLIKHVVTLKLNEWHDQDCNIMLHYNLNSKYVYLSPNKVKTIISDLLNNASESFDKPDKQIIITIDNQDSSSNLFTITIQDNGCGMSSEQISNATAGKSTKHNGKGLGLSGAYTYVTSIGGDINVSSELKYGTTIEIYMPIKLVPAWLTNTIIFSTNTSFVVLDDDLSVHSSLQNIFRKRSVKGNHFVGAEEYVAQLTHYNSLKNIIFIVDLNLNNINWDGFKIINFLIENNVDTSSIYLMTSDYDKLEVQNFVKKQKINLIPKDSLLHIALQNNNE